MCSAKRSIADIQRRSKQVPRGRTFIRVWAPIEDLHKFKWGKIPKDSFIEQEREGKTYMVYNIIRDENDKIQVRGRIYYRGDEGYEEGFGYQQFMTPLYKSICPICANYSIFSPLDDQLYCSICSLTIDYSK